METPPRPQTTFEYACEQVENLGYSCEGLEPPVVVYSKILDINVFMRLAGAHILGETYIFVHPDAPDVKKTEIHETTHYILHHNGVDERCRSEELARFVAGGQPDPTWRERYGCKKDDKDAP